MPLGGSLSAIVSVVVAGVPRVAPVGNVRLRITVLLDSVASSSRMSRSHVFADASPGFQ